MRKLEASGEKVLFADELIATLYGQGRTQKWLARRMDISEQSLSRKIKNNIFSHSEKYHIKDILDIK